MATRVQTIAFIFHKARLREKKKKHNIILSLTAHLPKVTTEAGN
jgi:hypothetical protein